MDLAKKRAAVDALCAYRGIQVDVLLSKVRKIEKEMQRLIDLLR